MRTDSTHARNTREVFTVVCTVLVQSSAAAYLDALAAVVLTVSLPRHEDVDRLYRASVPPCTPAGTEYVR